MSEAISSIIVAVITGGFAFLGVYISNNKTKTLIEYRLKQVEAKLDKHNHFDDRISALETDDALHEQELKRANKRLEKLEAHYE